MISRCLQDACSYQNHVENHLYNCCDSASSVWELPNILEPQPDVDTRCFCHLYTDFGQTNLGMPKSNLK